MSAPGMADSQSGGAKVRHGHGRVSGGGGLIPEKAEDKPKIGP